MTKRYLMGTDESQTVFCHINCTVLSCIIWDASIFKGFMLFLWDFFSLPIFHRSENWEVYAQTFVHYQQTGIYPKALCKQCLLSNLDVLGSFQMFCFTSILKAVITEQNAYRFLKHVLVVLSCCWPSNTNMSSAPLKCCWLEKKQNKRKQQEERNVPCFLILKQCCLCVIHQLQNV